MSYRSLLVFVCLLALPVAAFGQATVNVGSATTIMGGVATINVTVSAVPSPGVTDVQGTVTFDPAVVHITDAVGLNGFAGFFFKTINNTTGTMAFTGAIVGGNGVTAGDVMRLSLQATGTAGQSCVIGLAMTVFRDGNGNNISRTVNSGTFSISTTMPPTAAFSFLPASPTISDVIAFTDLSTDPDGSVLGWSWVFGDGGISMIKNPTHQYANGGTYTVSLTVTDNDGARGTTSHIVTVSGPSAAFTFTPTSPTTQDTVHFIDQSSSPGSNIASWSWNFNDTGASAEQSPTHRFASPGTYRVSLTITTRAGQTVSTFRDITVLNAPPIAAFTFSPAAPRLGEMVTFSAAGSSDPDGRIVSYEWDFDGDGVTDATGSSVTHGFDIVGARPVTLRVTDDSGAWSSVTHPVPVQTTPPTAAFTFTPTNPNTGQVITFDSGGSTNPGGTIILREWDFNNDGHTDATGLQVTHSFATAGAYPVTLKVTNSDGGVGVITHVVPVGVGGTGGANQPPVADFTFAPPSGTDVHINDVVAFKADGSSDPDGTIVAYEWDFNNDGIYDATGKDVTHVFHAGGAQIVMLKVTDDKGAPGYKSRVVAVQFVRPSANFTFDPAQPKVGDVVTFDGSSSTAANGRVEFYEWDFNNDGTIDATGKTVNHVYTTGGSKVVYLRVTDNDGITDFITKTVPVRVNNPPVANFTYTPASPTTADTVAFTSSSSDIDGSISAWLWNFGDGTTSNIQTPTHRYAAGGGKVVTLTVTDNEGATGNVTRTLTIRAVQNTIPVANFSFAPVVPAVNQAVTFTDLSTDADGTVTGWAWAFGDGATSTSAVKNPTHPYAAAGTYTVTLTVTDNLGGTSAAVTKTITVGQTGAQIATYSYPNPAVTQATISYVSPALSTGLVLRVYELSGKLVLQVDLPSALSTYPWNLVSDSGDALPTGLYFYVITGKDAAGKAIASPVFKLLIAR